MKAERAVVVRKVDSSVGERTAEELRRDIDDNNGGLQVDEVIKFPGHTHVFKIEFQTIAMAEKARQNGLLIFHTRIAPNQIEKEFFVDILMCFNCFALDNHTTEKCPNKNNPVICSECTGNHNFEDCTSITKRCVNCGGPHRTMAMKCPKKKEIAKKKRIEAQQGKMEKGEEHMPE